MPAKNLKALVGVDGYLEFRDPSNEDAWLATDGAEEVLA